MAETLELNLTLNTDEIGKAAKKSAREVKSAFDANPIDLKINNPKQVNALQSATIDAAKKASSDLKKVADQQIKVYRDSSGQLKDELGRFVKEVYRDSSGRLRDELGRFSRETEATAKNISKLTSRQVAALKASRANLVTQLNQPANLLTLPPPPPPPSATTNRGTGGGGGGIPTGGGTGGTGGGGGGGNALPTSQIREVADTLSKIGSLSASLGTSLTLGVTAPLVALGSTAVKSALDLDKIRAVLTALTGSTQKANEKFIQLKELAKTSPGVTTSFAVSLYSQLKAVGTISEEAIGKVIKSVGKLNSVFQLDDANRFARNLVQLFTQGFERQDVKEALGQVPVFEQLLQAAFGNADSRSGKKSIEVVLRQLKEQGKLTLNQWLEFLADAVNNDKRFSTIRESLALKIFKLEDELKTALEPLGLAILSILVPALEKTVPILTDLLNQFARLPKEVKEGIVYITLFIGILGPLLFVLGKVLGTVSTLITLFTTLSGTVAGAGGLTVVLGSIAGIVGPVAVGLGILGLAFLELKKRIGTTSETAEVFFGLISGSPEKTVKAAVTLANKTIGAIKLPAVPSAPGRPTKEFLDQNLRGLTPTTTFETGKEDPSVTRAKEEARKRGAEQAKRILRDAKEFEDAYEKFLNEQITQTTNILKAETDLRSAQLDQQLEDGLISYRKYSDEKFNIIEASTQREIKLLADAAEASEKELKGKSLPLDRVKIETELARLYGEQTVKLIGLTAALEDNFRAYKKRNELASLDLSKQLQEQLLKPADIQNAINIGLTDQAGGQTALSSLKALEDPRIIAAREKIKREKEAALAREIAFLDLGRQQIEIENAIELGQISRADGQKEINALLRQERDIRITVLEAEKASGGLSAQRVAEIDKEIASIRNLGVELTATQRFMRGFNSAIETTGDAFERLGQSISQSFGKVGGLLSNLKNAFKQFFNDLLGLGIQRVFQQLFGAITAAISTKGGGQAGGVTGGGIAGVLGGVLGGRNVGGSGGGGGGLLGNIFNSGGGGGGFLTPGFGGGFSGGGGGGGFIGGLPSVNTSGIGALGQAGIFGKAGTAVGLASLGNLFKGIGFGLKKGSATGPLAGIAPLLGLSLGASAGGSSSFGKILGGAGGALLGIGITAAPGALLAGGLLAGIPGAGALAALFSNPITAGVGAALLVGAVLLSRSKQRKSEEEQSGVWLQDAINQINDLKSQASQGQVTVEQARAIFEGQILATYTSQIKTLKTKSVRDSRLTNQVRDLRNLFETTVIPAAQGAAKRTTSAKDIIPEFATGGVVRGRDQGFDSVMAMVRPGEMVLTRQHQDAIAQIAGPSVFSRVGVPDAPQSTVNGMPAYAFGGVVSRSNSSDQPIEVNLVIDLRMGTSAATEIFAVAGSTATGRRVVVNGVRKARIDGDL